MWDHVILNGVLITSENSTKANIYIKDGKISAISEGILEGEAKEITDATGKYILPGFIDSHVHSRDGFKGAHYKEDFFHSSMAGAVGGVTTIIEMPNSNPAVYCLDTMNQLVECITPKAHVDFGVWGLCLGNLNMPDLEEMDKAGVAAFKFFWGYAIDEKTYQLIYNYQAGMKDVIPPLDDGEVFQIFREVAKTGKLIGIHAENFYLIKALTEEIMKGTDRGYDAVLRSRPPVSETTVIETAILFSKATGAHLHILHLGCGEGVDLIRQAKKEGLNVSAETCPHYLFLTDKDFERFGAQIKGYPPVRTQWDQDKVWEGLADGTLSFVCTDHAPHTPEEKSQDYWKAPAGMAAIETEAMLMLTAVNEGKITLNQLAGILSENAAKMFNFYPEKGSLNVGTDADIAIVDLEKEFVFDQNTLHSRWKLSPYHGRKMKGQVVQTILRGKTIAKDGDIIGEPSGRFTKPQP